MLEAVTALLRRDGTTRDELRELVSVFPESREIPDYLDLRGILFNDEIYGLDLEPVDLSYAHSLQGRQVENPFIELKRCNIRSSRLNFITTELVISVSQADGSEMIGTNLRKNIFRASSVAGCRFDEAKLVSSDFVGCDLTNSSFRDADLTNATLVRAKCVDTDFRGAKLRGALFDDAILSPDTKFDGAPPSASGDEVATMREIIEVARRLVRSRYSEYAHLEPTLDRLAAGFRDAGGADVWGRVSDEITESERADLAYLMERAAREV